MFNTKKPKAITPNQTPTRSIVSNASKPTADNAPKPSAASVIAEGSTIKGDITGTNDISIFGKVDGTITLKNNTLTIEQPANITANITAKTVHINGSVVGNIESSEKIVISDTGNVTGDMVAPKVILKDGSYFKGNVSMVDNEINTKAMQKP